MRNLAREAAAATGRDLDAELGRLCLELLKQALEGDIGAARLILERLAGRPPEPAGEPIDLPDDLDTAQGLLEAQKRILAAAAAGEVPSEVAARLSAVVRQASDASVLRQAVQDLEQLKRGER